MKPNSTVAFDIGNLESKATHYSQRAVPACQEECEEAKPAKPGRRQLEKVKWEKDVESLLNTKNWLMINGLKRNKLDLNCILPTLGFKHSTNFVDNVGKEVCSRYAEGLFHRLPRRDGLVYNLTCSKDRLQILEQQLLYSIMLFKARNEWLTTESRRIFGVIQERNICIILDVHTVDDAAYRLYIEALELVLREQVSRLARFNMTVVGDYPVSFSEQLVDVDDGTIEDAIAWMWKLERSTVSPKTGVIETVMRAKEDPLLDSLYLFSEGEASIGSKELLRNKLKQFIISVHCVAYNAFDSITINFLKDISLATAGRLWEEMEEARISLAEVQRLVMEYPDPTVNVVRTSHKKPVFEPVVQSEQYMSSKQWLANHGLETSKLGYWDFMDKVSFKHCDGVFNAMHPPADPHDDKALPDTKRIIVNAQYCDKFVHVKWKTGAIRHVHIPSPIFRAYQEKAQLCLDKIQRRVEWLCRGSRQLFGTIVEDSIYVLVDVSNSMEPRLSLVKDKIYSLLQEQIRHKVKFNLVKFGTHVDSWHDRLVDVTEQNLKSAWEWIKDASIDGSTNTLAALKKALSDKDVEAVYLLTDGRPDHPPNAVLAQVHMFHPTPIHTISFNCTDREANEFLFRLSNNTNGRYHYYNENLDSNYEGPPPFIGEDLRLLKTEYEEMKYNMKVISALRQECVSLEWSKNVRPENKPRPNREHILSDQPLAVDAKLEPWSLYRGRSGVPKNRKKTPVHSRPKSALPHIGAAQSKMLRSFTNTNTLGMDDGTKYLMKETKDVFESQSLQHQNAVEFTDRKVVRRYKRRRAGRKPFIDNYSLSSAEWLDFYGLVARKLTVMDALSPTVIKHKSTFVPSLNKSVESKVFDGILPLCYTSSSRGSHDIKLVNPLAVDLLSYEERLTAAMGDIKRRLNHIIWEALPAEEREQFGSNSPVSFVDNREKLLDSLDHLKWPLPKDDVTLLDEEHNLGNKFLTQSEELRKLIKKQRSKSEKRVLDRSIDKLTRRPTIQSSDFDVKTKQLPSNKGLTVLAQHPVDGFYHKGTITKVLSPDDSIVTFKMGNSDIVATSKLLPITGSISQPHIGVGDFVLMGTGIQSKSKGRDLDIYTPGIVRLVPHPAKPKSYTVVTYDGHQSTCVRAHLIKIGKQRFKRTVNAIRRLHENGGLRSESPIPWEHETITNGRKSVASEKHKKKPIRGEKNTMSRSRSSSSGSSSSSSGSSDGSSSAWSAGSKSKSKSSTESTRSVKSDGFWSQDEVNVRMVSRPEKKKPLQNEKKNRREKDSRRDNDAISRPKSRMTRKDDPDGVTSANKEGDTDPKITSKKGRKSNESKMHSKNSEDKKKVERKKRETTQEITSTAKETLHTTHEIPKQSRSPDSIKNAMEVKPNRRGVYLPKSPRDDSSSDSVDSYSGKVTAKGKNEAKPTRTHSPSSSSSTIDSEEDSKLKSSRSNGNPVQSPSNRQKLFRFQDEPPSDSDDGQKQTLDNPDRRSNQTKTVVFDNDLDEDVVKQVKLQEIRISSSSASSTSNNVDPKHPDSKKEQPVKIEAGGSVFPPLFTHGAKMTPVSDSGTSESDDASSSSVSSETTPDTTPRKRSWKDVPYLYEQMMRQRTLHVIKQNDKRNLYKDITVYRQISTTGLDNSSEKELVTPNDKILFRWEGDSFYYAGKPVGQTKQGSNDEFLVEDEWHNLNTVPKDDIIIVREEENPSTPFVIALYPGNVERHAPGQLKETRDDQRCVIVYYDDSAALVNIGDCYPTTEDNYFRTKRMIADRAEARKGTVVVARCEDGYYKLAYIKERHTSGHDFIVEFGDSKMETVQDVHLYGPLRKSKSVEIGDYVIAPIAKEAKKFLPGMCKLAAQDTVSIVFCNEDVVDDVEKLMVFTITQEIHDQAVAYIENKYS